MDNVNVQSDASKARLKSYVERVERLEDNKQEITEDIREVFKEAKSEGFDTKIMKKIIKLRAMDAEDRLMQEELIDLYKQALGMTFGDASDEYKIKEIQKEMAELQTAFDLGEISPEYFDSEMARCNQELKDERGKDE